MNALILAAGLGTRLGSYTQDRPKALVEIAGRTMLEHQLRRLSSFGFDHFTVNVHHFAPMITDYLEQNRNFGLDIRISDESGLLLDTGGGIRKAMHMFSSSGPVLVHNVDIFSSADLKALYDRHVANKSSATLLTQKRQTHRYMYFDDRGRLTGWCNVKTGQTKSPYPTFVPQFNEALAFQGIHVLSPDLLPSLDKIETPTFSITDFYVDSCSVLDIRRYSIPDMLWADAGRPETLEMADKIVREHYLE
ncbi:MAG: NTP transferase domain-containing protein [Bacteroidaceae bacterium]|nr:NTP transferase domain-containing protein [Bacteroidaceae bacterium]